ncbi:hypothetical protein J6590_032494 [Homalodisca vitripennis]|nr:hypothetical protein J6590_032494 [Homalodisca vitripennis]
MEAIDEMRVNRSRARGIRALISKSCLTEEGKATSQSASPVKAGRWYTLVEANKYTPFSDINLCYLWNEPHHLQQPIELQLHPGISTFAVSDVVLLDIHKVAQI